MRLCEGHIFFHDPPSRRNKYSEYYVSKGDVDYNLMAPLNTPGYKFPCKGFPKGPVTKVINGNSIQITLEGSAIHNGGHCQFGISYDDNTFLVLKTVMMDCLLNGMTYTVDMPNNMPSGEFTFFWTWINKVGNREYYMECADMSINTNNNVNSPLTGKELVVANLPGYPSIPEFLQPDAYNGSDLFEQRKDISIMPFYSPSTTQPTLQPISQPVSQPVSPSVLHPNLHPTSPSVLQPVSPSVTQSCN